MPRVITNEVLQRIYKVDLILSEWMKEANIPEASPEDCMELLVNSGVYNYDSHRRGHYFREDLRTLRDCGELGIFEKLVIEQKRPSARWNIKLVK